MTGPLTVVYDEGAVTPGEIVVGLAEVAPCVFAVGTSQHARSMEPLLAQFGPVVRTDSADQAAAELRAHAPGGIVTFSERALPLACALAERLGLPFHSRHTTGLLTDTWRQRSRLRAAGLATVRSYRVAAESGWAAAVAAVGLPAVLRPATSGAGSDTYLIENEEAGRRIVRRLLSPQSPGLVPGGALVLEEHGKGRACGPFGALVSVEILVCDGQITELAVTGKLPLPRSFRETGYFLPAPLPAPEEEEVRALARIAVAALGIKSGFTHTEIKLTESGPRLSGVRGCLGGGMHDLAARALGVDAIALAGQVALGEPVTIAHPPVHRVYFHLLHHAPRRACELLAVEGVREIQRLPGVMVHRPFIKAGTALSGGAQAGRLGAILGDAADLRELAALVAEINARVRYRFSFEGMRQARSVTAAELGDL